MARYEIRRADTGEVLRKHRTRQGALDGWRGYVGTPVQVWRTYSTGKDVLVFEGTWHLARDVDDDT